MQSVKNKIIPTLLFSLVWISQASNAQDTLVVKAPTLTLPSNNLLIDYQKEANKNPPQATFIKEETLQGVTVRHFRMTFPIPTMGKALKENKWQHDVTFYIPANPLRKRSLFIINNGINNPLPGGSVVQPTDFTQEMLVKLANETQTILTAISDIPNQYLVDEKDGKRRKEDDSVAHSWDLFMNNSTKGENLPLQLPMTAAVSQAMSLAERELKEWDIKSFIVTGLSKRGWTTWLSAISDPRVDAIVPFVIDLLNQRKTLAHMYKVYGGNWPVAFTPYYNESIDKRINTSRFEQLMKIQDPFAYLQTEYKKRLSIPKYIINASGDDFYVPDNTQFYYDHLPGERSLRVIPNSNHYGVKAFAVESLIHFTQRIQKNIKLPDITAKVEKTTNAQTLTAHFSEPPVKLTLWSANNTQSRDFRFACNIRYQQTALSVPANNLLKVDLPYPSEGWNASFIEATFSDGYVATTPVFISDDDAYPEKAPEKLGPACQTLPGRGLG